MLENLQLVNNNRTLAIAFPWYSPRQAGPVLLRKSRLSSSSVSLSELNLTGAWVSWNTLDSGILRNLTTLVLDRIPYTKRPTPRCLRDIVVACAGSLVSLKLHCVFSIPESLRHLDVAALDGSLGDPLVLPKVKQLDIGFVMPPEALYVLSLFSFPQLVDLRIKDVHRSLFPAYCLQLSVNHTANILEQIVRQPLPTVERLELCNIILPGPSGWRIVLFLETFSRVRMLSLDNCDPQFADALSITALEYETPTECVTRLVLLLPLLEKLYLTTMDKYGFLEALSTRRTQALENGVEMEKLPLVEMWIRKHDKDVAKRAQ